MATLTLVTDPSTDDDFARAVERLLPPVPSNDAPRRRASPSHPAFGRSRTRLSVVLSDEQASTEAGSGERARSSAEAI